MLLGMDALSIQTRAAPRGPREATPVSAIQVLDGFKIELIRDARAGEGSWVAMTIDNKGRLIISPQGKEPMLRVTLKDGAIEKIEPLNAPVTGAMGLLYAFDSLYVNGQGPDGYHFYRLRDTDGEGKYGAPELLQRWNRNRGGNGEHGAHGIVVGPDKKLYMVCGNFVDVPENISSNSPHKNYADDLILPRSEDGNGFGAGKKPPGGFVVRMEPDGKNAELFAAGFRNTYDIAFNADGELFGFDSDMEWDWGTPWYRPIRINHIVSGADFGFREGTAKWPIYYPDSLPTTLDIGIGSPTGVKFGTNSKFPEKYRKAFYVMDWSYGRIVAVHLAPRGATYAGSFENFVAPKSLTGAGPKVPLNVTDLEFGPDGAMYFLIGGRGTQSGLYRVSYTGGTALSSNAGTVQNREGAEARALRRQLETFQTKKDESAVDFAWPHLNSEDRWIRYAARLAIENQDVALWQTRALAEKQINGSLTALLALARKGDSSLQKDVLKGLSQIPADRLNENQKLELLRVLSLAFIRMGKPDAETASAVVEAVDPFFPSQSPRINRELCQLLIYLNAPGVVQKTLNLIAASTTQEDQIHYIFHLRNLKTGWTLDQRRRYFEWFNKNRAEMGHPSGVLKWFTEAGRPYSDGASFPKFIANIRKDAIASLSESEHAQLSSVLAGELAKPKPPAAPRNFVQQWKADDLLPALDQVSKGRVFANGERAFNDAQCIACHRFGNEGGAVGPDLTAIASRFTRRDILDSILEPSKVVSEQYQNLTVTLKNGDDFTGRLVEEDDQKVVLITDPLKQTRSEIRRTEIQKRAPSKISPMPEGLVNTLTREEILDLLAYLESGGKREHAAFKTGN